MENIENECKKRIICVGNRFKPEDSAGPMVYDQLANHRFPGNIEVIDGGLAGLNLLRFIHGADRIVFIDAVNGFKPFDGVIVLNAEDASRHADTIFGHSAGLAYCLRVLPEVHDGKMPEIFVVGIEGATDPDKILKAAEISLKIAAHGYSLN
jgi:hydrogenase maturation protease